MCSIRTILSVQSQNDDHVPHPKREVGFWDTRLEFLPLRVPGTVSREAASSVHDWKGSGLDVVRFDRSALSEGVSLCKLTAGSPSIGIEHSFIQMQEMLLTRGEHFPLFLLIFRRYRD